MLKQHVTWLFFLLASLSQIILAQDCSKASDCKSCVNVRDIQRIQQCVWCRTNETCRGRLDICPSDEVNTDDSVLMERKCTLPKDLSGSFYNIAIGLALILLFSCVAAYIYSHFRNKKEMELKEDKNLKMRKTRSEKRKKAKKRKVKHSKRSSKRTLKRSSKQHEEEVVISLPKEKKSVQKDIYWEVVSKKLRVRGEASKKGEKAGILHEKDLVLQISRKDNWLQHEAGWSMITDGKGNNGAVFLKLCQKNSTHLDVSSQQAARSNSRSQERNRQSDLKKKEVEIEVKKEKKSLINDDMGDEILMDDL